VALSLYIYIYSFFFIQKDQYLREIKEVSQNSAARAFTAIGSLSKSITTAATITSHYEPDKKNFTFFSVPYFHIQATETQRISGAEAVIYTPLVHKSVQEQWEAYSVVHQDWLLQGLEYRGVNVTEQNPGPIPTKVYTLINPNQDGANVPYNNNSFIEQQQQQQHVPGEVHVTNYVLPVWQMVGAPINASIINLDLLSTPYFELVMVDAMITRKGILSQMNDYHFLTKYSTATKVLMEQEEEEDETIQRKSEDTGTGGNHHHYHHPQTFMMEPVFESFEANAAVVGFIIAIFPWNNYFVNVLPDGVDVFVVVRDRCGHVHTWDADGPIVTYMGEGDKTRSDHAHQLESFEFAPYARHDNEEEIPHPPEFIYGWQGQEEQEEMIATNITPVLATSSTVAPSSTVSVIETVGGRRRRTTTTTTCGLA
jgi:hypothetical protein